MHKSNPQIYKIVNYLIKIIFMEIVPKQETGKQYDNIETVICANTLDAEEKYSSACTKLFLISEWGKIGSTILQTEFCLCNSEGKEVSQTPQKGDYIRINLAGPGSKSGEGFDWVQIEQIAIKAEENDTQLTSIKVRPAACPLNNSDSIAHFFDDAATTTFIVSRTNNKVTAEIHGRNEEPNTNTTHIVDNVRNTVVATFAAVKFSDIQWKSLCEGFLA